MEKFRLKDERATVKNSIGQCAYWNRLVHLDIGNIDNDCLGKICETCPSIERLSIDNCWDGNVCLDPILLVPLKKLETLYLHDRIMSMSIISQTSSFFLRFLEVFPLDPDGDYLSAFPSLKIARTSFNVETFKFQNELVRTCLGDVKRLIHATLCDKDYTELKGFTVALTRSQISAAVIPPPMSEILTQFVANYA